MQCTVWLGAYVVHTNTKLLSAILLPWLLAAPFHTLLDRLTPHWILTVTCAKMRAEHLDWLTDCAFSHWVHGGTETGTEYLFCLTKGGPRIENGST
ncbi:hypothetical protein F5882DRAFT_388718 [Hyaloscypha sp. PMI_1271]|nr:hypothetical protein F5882DRAFT_388718 [Hyaloscypha sp. PMI_1271]